MCMACDLRGKTWQGSDPVCGFTNGSFNPENWNCATLNTLRHIAALLDTVQSMEDTSLATIPTKGDDHDGWIVLSWYKSRGRTSSARFMFDDTDIPLTLEIAESAINQYQPMLEAARNKRWTLDTFCGLW